MNLTIMEVQEKSYTKSQQILTSRFSFQHQPLFPSFFPKLPTPQAAPAPLVAPDDSVVLRQLWRRRPLLHAPPEGLGVAVHHVAVGADAVEMALGVPNLLVEVRSEKSGWKFGSWKM